MQQQIKQGRSKHLVAVLWGILQTRSTRTEPTMGPRGNLFQLHRRRLLLIFSGTQPDPIPSSFAQVSTRRTQKVAAPEFKEPKNFTQLQKLYNKREITPQQYEMYKNRLITVIKIRIYQNDVQRGIRIMKTLSNYVNKPPFVTFLIT